MRVAAAALRLAEGSVKGAALRRWWGGLHTIALSSRGRAWACERLRIENGKTHTHCVDVVIIRDKLWCEGTRFGAKVDGFLESLGRMPPEEVTDVESN
jgi:hypothetical protein